MDERSVAAAANAIAERWPQFMSHARAIATLALMAAKEVKPHVFTAKTVDGRTITIRHWDKGDIVPAFDESKRRYEAYTSYFQADDWDEYVQVDKRAVEASHDPAAFRHSCNMLALRARGIDTNTIID